MQVEVHELAIDLLMDDSGGALQAHRVVLQLQAPGLPPAPFSCNINMTRLGIRVETLARLIVILFPPTIWVLLLYNEGGTVDVEREFLAVDGDEGGGGAGRVLTDSVRNLLTEGVHVVVPQVVVAVVEARDHQTAAGQLALHLISHPCTHSSA